MIVIVKNVQVQMKYIFPQCRKSAGEDEVYFLSIFGQVFLTSLFPLNLKHCHSVILYSLLQSRRPQELLNGFPWFPCPTLSFVLCEQVKFRPNKKFKIKASHSVVAIWTLCVCVWWGGGGGVEGRGW